LLIKGINLFKQYKVALGYMVYYFMNFVLVGVKGGVCYTYLIYCYICCYWGWYEWHSSL